MKQLLIIPDINNMEMSLELAKKYSLGFEYNDFFVPEVLDDEYRLQELVDKYKSYKLPQYCTMHGAFYDVIPFSSDPRIREISVLRIEQSIEAAKKMGAEAVVFHTNYNPFLNSSAYIKEWVQLNTVFWCGIYEKYSDINIYLENMFDVSPDMLERLALQLSKYNNFGICLDYGHASLSSAAEPRGWVESLGKYVKHIHINDNDFISDLHLAWGDGEVIREEFYYLYNMYMSDATILIETNSEENIRKSLDMLFKDGFI